MLNIIADFVKSILPAKKTATPNGWIKFNAPCCTHNGETPDTRMRGGFMFDTDGKVGYHCFNCNFITGFYPGRHLSFKFRKLLKWLGAGENDIKRLVIEAIRIRELVAPETVKAEAEEEKIEFKTRDLPEGAVSFQQFFTFYELNNFENIPSLLNSAVNYTNLRKINYDRYDFLWTDSTEHSLHQRVIIPFIWQGRTIGYTARAVNDGVKPKYYSSYEPNFVFNTNNQLPDSKFVIVCEGPFDAMSIDGVAVLNNECNETQADIIESLGREVIVVADRDRAGARMINNAIEYGWSVSFPVWLETCKDINEATVKYGKLFVLKTILDSKHSSKLKIELMKKKLYN
jgi:5S rRNA maturation endonuclease (ribonuclease M5)